MFKDDGKVEVLFQDPVCSGFLKVYRYILRHLKYDGSWSPALQREVVDRGHAVAVLLVDWTQRKVVLVEQFRPGALDDVRGAWLLETVAGVIDAGESPAEAACREVLEETGLPVQALRQLYTFYPSPGACSETITLFQGEVSLSDLRRTRGGAPDEQEDILIRALSFEAAFDLARTGEIRNATTLIALQWLERELAAKNPR